MSSKLAKPQKPFATGKADTVKRQTTVNGESGQFVERAHAKGGKIGASRVGWQGALSPEGGWRDDLTGEVRFWRGAAGGIL
jgi:hypothetical protein